MGEKREAKRENKSVGGGAVKKGLGHPFAESGSATARAFHNGPERYQ